MKRLICLFLAIILLVGIAATAWMDAGKRLFEQTEEKSEESALDTDALQALREFNDGSVPVISVREDGTPYIIFGSYSDQKVTDAESAIQSMNDLSDLMNFSDTIDSFEVTRTNQVDENVYYRLQRYHDQYPVYGQEFVISTDEAGNILSLSSGNTTITEWASEILVTEDDARNVASAHCGGSFGQGELMFYVADNNSSARLVWRFTGANVVFVDAGSGEVLTSFSSMNTAYYEAAGIGIPDEDVYREIPLNLARNDCDTSDSSDDIYLFYDYSRNIYYYDAQHTVLDRATYRDSCNLLSGTDTIFGDGVESEQKAVSLYEKLSIVYDFYKEYVKITSYDNNGGLIIALVDENYQNGYNAYNWGPDVWYNELTTFLAFGSNRTYHKQLDIVGHEFTHAVQHATVSGGVACEKETGALMEAYSDVMGEIIELHSTGTSNWCISNLRNISDPSNTGDPEIYHGENWYTKWQTDDDNSIYVHQNSTVMSHALYKMYSRGLCSAEDMAVFLYKAWQHMTATGDFQQYSNCLFLAATEMNMRDQQREIISTALKEAGIENDWLVNVSFEVRDAITNRSLRLEDGAIVSDIQISMVPENDRPDKPLLLTSKKLITTAVLNGDEDYQTFDYSIPYGKWSVTIQAEDYVANTFSITIDEAIDRWFDVKMHPKYEELNKTPHGEVIPVDAIMYNGNSYYIFDNSMNWNEAKAYCEERGGHLVTITDADEQDFLTSMVEDAALNCYWIGATDTSGSWAWVTDELFSYTNWKSGEPNDENVAEDYAVIITEAKGASQYGFSVEVGDWNDVTMTGENGKKDNPFYTPDSLGFICEWENTSVHPTVPGVQESYTVTEGDESIYLEYLMLGTYRQYFDDGADSIYSYALVDIDQDGISELLVTRDRDDGQYVHGWQELLIIAYDSWKDGFQAIAWEHSQDATYVMSGAIYYSAAYKSVVYSPGVATNAVSTMVYWSADRGQMQEALHVWRDIAGESRKYWIEIPEEHLSNVITEDQYSSYIDELSCILFDPVP